MSKSGRVARQISAESHGQIKQSARHFKARDNKLDILRRQTEKTLFPSVLFLITENIQKIMALSANDIRKGMVILFEGTPVRVMEFRHHTPGNLRAMVQTRLRNLLTGNSFEHRFRSNDTLDRITLEQHDMEYLYSDGEHHHFMNTENYEQVSLREEELGDAVQWLMPNLKIQVEFYDGTPIGVQLPASMELVVRDTEPVMKGATASNSNKPATLENGVTLYVPPFILPGEKIRVNPTESKYMERVK
jgi:elongation factor P